MSYLHSKRHSTFGAAGASAKATSASASASALADSVKAQIKNFTDTVKRVADRMFNATRLKRDSDRILADTAKAAAFNAQSVALSGSTMSSASAAGAAFLKNPGAAKAAISGALTEIKTSFVGLDTDVFGTSATTLSLIQSLTALVTSINSGIDQAVKAAADEAAAAAKRAATASSFTPSTPSPLPPPTFPTDSGGGAKPPWAVIAFAVGAALLLIPSKGK
jgi:hypothetical protein